MIRQFIFYFAITLVCVIPSASNAELFIYHDKATDLYGFQDADGNVVIPPQFDLIIAKHGAKLFSAADKDYEFLVPVRKNQGRFWRITSDGTLKFETVFWENIPDPYENGLARFIKDHKVGFHDRKGEIIIQPAYDFASPFKDGHANVCKGCYAIYPNCKSLTYYPASSGNGYMVREKHHSQNFEDLSPSIVGGKWGIIDTQGNILVSLVHSSLEEADKAFKKLNNKRRAQ